jgi:hypothetical protein
MEEENPSRKSALRSAVATGCCMWTPIAQTAGDAARGAARGANVTRTASPDAPASSVQSVAAAPARSGTKNG